jgi:hypothetical protein
MAGILLFITFIRLCGTLINQLPASGAGKLLILLDSVISHCELGFTL